MTLTGTIFLRFWLECTKFLYEDEDHDKVVLASDSDLTAAVDHARSAGWKGLKLHLDYSGTTGHRRGSSPSSLDYAHTESAWASAYSTVAAGAALVAGLGVLAFLRRSGN
uniref:CBS domain-containing protein CBSCBSPB5 isoform X4 n=1 Tax=Nicotiana tabacum TaxID=4097 RepID=A0A1S4AGS1_TOBAC|nr:PREDICTED: CBS domain-containing protein CBSCBSPB5-like isoform X4 [Nicotiana tabacum]